MARMHTHSRGQSHSTRPVSKRPPPWCQYSPEEVEALVVKLAKEGVPPSEIGVILRDQYGIPLVKAITGKKICQILREAGLEPKIPEDLARLLEKAERMKRHLMKHKGDKKNIHNAQLLESKIHRLVKYYKRIGRLPADWKYEPFAGKFI